MALEQTVHCDTTVYASSMSTRNDSLESDNPPTSISHDDAKDGDDLDVAELLKQLNSADGIAIGVEQRLDKIIGNLDLFIEALEDDPSFAPQIPVKQTKQTSDKK